MKKLKRRLTLPAVIAIGIGGMLGSGIFVLPGIAAAKTGPSLWLAYLLAGLCVLPAALSKSELASAMPTSGGTYIYIERAFGPILGTIAGLGLWLSLLLKSSFALVGFGAYLLVLADIPLKLTSLGFLGLIMALNIFGVKKVGDVQIGVVSLSLLGLLTLVIFGIPNVEPANMRPFLTHGNEGLLATAAFVFVSYAGVTKVAAIAEEIKNPGRNLPLAMMLVLVVIAVVYTLVSFTLVGNIPVEQLHHDLRPIYTLASHLAGHWGGLAAAVLGVITLMSMANSGVLAASRFPFAMSRDRLVPILFSKVNPRFLTPVSAIIATCFLMALAITFLDVERIAKLASAFKVMMFMAVNACVIILRETAVQWYTPPYRSPFYPWMQIFGIVSGMVLLVLLGATGLLGALVISLIGGSIYFFYGRLKAQRSGVLKKYGHRPALFLLYRRSWKKQIGEGIPKPSAEATKSSNLDGSLAEEAGVVVPLFGKERSAEMLAEMGAALSMGQKVQVVHLKEVPDQTDLEALLEESPTITSLNRRITAMAKERKVDVDFDAVVTHELVDTIYQISRQTHCRWLVSGWEGRARTRLLVRNPIGWLVTHLDSNFALFKDNGVRYIRRILIALRPHRNDPRLIEAASRIAAFYEAELTLLRVAGNDANSDEIREIKLESKELLKASSVPVKLIVKASRQPIDTVVKMATEYDLLITGTPGKENWLDVLFGTHQDRFSHEAPCSVLRLTIN
ncbi:MAG: amino acid permease [Phaeodactylibacter sp.]|nr:amino acid permease [Phaeodactylibacter sp.]MCB9267565.1 amino acid permease [Lewinellaceae bacterium]MCB9288953.1 amino acid permease [Lewinellaceae bacterium]